MNKKFKLSLLALSLPVSASAIIPFVSSCKSNGATFITDGSEQFAPKYKPAVADVKKYPEGYTADDATSLYFDALEKNPDLFLDELKCGVGNFIYGCTNGLVGTKTNHLWLKGNFKATYSNVSVNKEKQTISFHLHASCDSLAFHLFETSSPRDISEYVKLDSLDCDYQNIGYRAVRGYKITGVTDQLFWSVIPKQYDELPRDYKYSIKANGYLIAMQKKFEYKNNEYVCDYYNRPPTSTELGYLVNVCRLFCNVWTSSYLQDIVYKEEANK